MQNCKLNFMNSLDNKYFCIPFEIKTIIFWIKRRGKESVKGDDQ